MLNLKDINLTFGKDTKLERKIFSNLTLNIKEGEFVSIIGNNGAGKSTLFSLISGYLNPNSGKIIIDGQNVTRMPQIERSKLVAKVMQDPRIGTVENMTIEENMSCAYMRGQTRGFMLHNSSTRREIFKKKLEILDIGLEDKLDEFAGNLSGGQRQAMSIIMAIIAEFKILLLDEITAALDPKTAEIVMNLAARIAKEEKRTTIMITHNMQHAANYSDRIVLLANGAITKEFSGGVNPTTLIENMNC